MDQDLKKTPLYDEHVRLGGKIVPFAGFAMPVQYPTGIRAEHAAVREAVGMFDVSHMGEFRVRGPDALRFISYATTNDPSTLVVGDAQYSAMCHPGGGVVDDLLVYRYGEEDLRLVVNAANLTKDWDHLEAILAGFDAEMEDESDDVGLIAVQGPGSQELLSAHTETDLDAIGYYSFELGAIAGVPCAISRTGYTGEDGFELYLPADGTATVWSVLEAAGALPAGLGCRDSLRLEMGYALYGNDIDDETTALEAGLGWLVKFDKGDFVGRAALLEQKEAGVPRRLRGIKLLDRGFPRPGYTVRFEGEDSGVVRSGTVSPTLGYGVATVYLPPAAGFGAAVEVIIRDQPIAAEVVRPPFYTEGSIRR
ncbi:MAG: glycine cleavage system aminomethyltransferase GcvT [Gemmatimonadota bacterium]|nr:glycine cleavage system aminomethyltransferase GcvT [Gemmatimonadota bacterium]